MRSKQIVLSVKYLFSTLENKFKKMYPLNSIKKNENSNLIKLIFLKM